MEIMQTQMRDVNLDVFVFVLIATIFIKLFFNFEEALFDLFFNFGLQLLFEVVHLKVLALEILQWLTLLFKFLFVFVIFFNRFRNFKICVLRVISHLARGIYQWQIYL